MRHLRPVLLVALLLGSLACGRAPSLRWDLTERPDLGLRSVWDTVAVGRGGLILRYDGRAWKPEASPVGQELFSVWGASPNDVYAVGGPRILHYDGRGWSLVEGAGPREVLTSVWGSGPSDFWFGGYDALLRWDGKKVSPAPHPPVDNVYGLGGTSASEVFAVGLNDTVLRYDGSAWTRLRGQKKGSGPSLVGVWCPGPGDAFVVGYEGTILRYRSGHLQPMNSGTRANLMAVWGRSAEDVYAVGGGPVEGAPPRPGVILHFDGRRWSPVEQPAPVLCTSLWGCGDGLVVTGLGFLLQGRP